jgi:hypothetical protein
MVYFVCPLLVATLGHSKEHFNFPCVDIVAQFTNEVSVCLAFAPPIFDPHILDTSVPITSLAMPLPNALCRNRQLARRVSYFRGTKWGSSAALTAWGRPIYRNGSTASNIRGTLPTLRKQSRPFTVKAV